MTDVKQQDSDENRKADEALRVIEQKYRSLVETTDTGYVILDKQGIVLDANKEYVRLTGRDTLAAVIGHSVLEWTAPYDHARNAEEVRKCAEQGFVRNLEIDYLSPAGQVTPIEINATILEAGGEMSILSLCRDITERKQAETALRENEERLRAISNNLASGMIYQVIRLKEGVRQFTYLSEKVTSFYGITPQEGLADASLIYGRIHKDDRQRVFLEEEQANQTLSIFKTETRMIGPQGEIRWSYFISSPTQMPDGATRWDGIEFDITERKRAEEALRESYKTSEDIVRAIPSGLFIYRYVPPDNLILVSGNPAAESLTGIKVEEWKGKEFNEIWPAAKQSGVTDSYLEVVRTGKTFETEDLYYQDNRLSGAFRIRAFMLPGDRLAIAFENITERKKSESTLRESEHLFRQLFEMESDAIFLIDNQTGQIIEANLAASLLYGFNHQELLAMKNTDLSAEPEETQRVTQGMPVVVDNLVTIPLRWHHKKDGTVFPVEITGRFFERHGRPVHIAAIRDITNRKKAEEEKERLQAQLLQAQKMESVGRLAGGVAHDFNNMLGIILGYAELVKRHLVPGDPISKGIEEIIHAANRSADLTRQLLAFARKQTVTPKVFALNDTVSGMIKMLSRLIGEEIELEWRPGASLWLVRIDPSQLDQILANLCVNARDAIAGRGQITIETANITYDTAAAADFADMRAGDYVMLAVSDNGCGMEQDVLANIFEPFFTTKGVGQGTGLGLAMVYGIVKQNAGVINVSSTPGIGTTFKIFLPRYVDKADRASETVQDDAVLGLGGPETVLLVEDEPMMLAAGTSMLEALGYKVMPAGTPGEAIRLAEENAGEIQLLMTDVVMPEMNGRDLAKRLLSLYPNLNRLFMSGYTADVIAPHGVLEEGVHFIQKPFSMRELADAVRAALEKPKY